MPFLVLGFPDGSVGKEPSCNVGDTGDAGSICGLGRFPGEGNGNLLQYYYLGNPVDREAWQATVHGVTKGSDRTEATEHSTAQSMSVFPLG